MIAAGAYKLTPTQLALIEAPTDGKIFLSGPAGAGKTTAAAERLLAYMAAGIPGQQILLLVPQRTLAEPYNAALRHPGVVAGGVVDILTLGGLAQRSLDLYWPQIAPQAGFQQPDSPPTFLTLETAQYYMASLVEPLLKQGHFDSTAINPNRLYSQILDNLNKAAVTDFPHTEIGARLRAAWAGDPGQLHIYDDVQLCANLFRDFCLQHNLLDFSLQVQAFWHYFWPDPDCRAHLTGRYRHLFVDNTEEDTPVAHDLLQTWLPECHSALLIYDNQAGYRRFLGADPQSAQRLRASCDQQLAWTESFVTSPAVHNLALNLAATIDPTLLTPAELDLLAPPQAAPAAPRRPVHAPQAAELHSADLRPAALRPADLRPAFDISQFRYFPELLDWTAQRIAGLVFDEQIPPGEIVVLAPFLSDALRFSLSSRLQALGVPARSHRPSRSLREEPASLCLLTLSVLAHPHWLLPRPQEQQTGSADLVYPSEFDVAAALLQAIDGLDLVRAQLLARIVYRKVDGRPTLTSFEQLRPDMQGRITYQVGQRYERLRLWLENAAATEQEYDHFLSRLFGELLSQPGYGFHANYDAGEVAANLIESVQKFRWVAGPQLAAQGRPLGLEYLRMVQDGVIAAQYIRSWRLQPEDAVLLAPAYTFLMSNRPVQAQFWIDIGSSGWFERLYQPLTHPYILSRAWPVGRQWNDLDEIDASRDALARLTLGLLRRCRWKLFLGISELGEQGYEQRGPLLHAFQRLLQFFPGRKLENEAAT